MTDAVEQINQQASFCSEFSRNWDVSLYENSVMYVSAFGMNVDPFAHRHHNNETAAWQWDSSDHGDVYVIKSYDLGGTAAGSNYGKGRSF